jgi:heme/copper-type cytochrome/quinol oxidase subunit 1
VTPERRFDIEKQQAEILSNVAGNQYNQYIQQVLRERESFAHDIAATKTKARALVWLGFLMLAGGSIAFMIPLLQAMNEFDMNSYSTSDPFSAGPEIGGYSVGLIGFGIAFIGQFVLIVGIILHVVAASRRKKLLSLPPPHVQYFPDRWQ